MINEMREFILELVQSEYETGHRLAEDRNEFNKLCRDEGYRATKAMYDLYEECHNLGPAGFYAEYKGELDFDPMFVAEYTNDREDENDEFEDYHLDEALSNKEKLKRAYPELNFDSPVGETLNEAIDLVDKMRTAVGILFDMDNFTLSVRDNGYWLSMGVPDGEFSENDRDLAEADYIEHQWLIEDDDGEFDVEAFKDLVDAFEVATDDSDYDQNERAKIIHEAEIILNMNESVEDMDKRCENCNTLLNDMGKCPKCDEGEEDLDEAALLEWGKNKLSNRLKKFDKAEAEKGKKLAKQLLKILTYSFKDMDKNRYYIDGKAIPFKDIKPSLDIALKIARDPDKLSSLSESEAEALRKIIDDVIVVNNLDYLIKRGLEVFKSGKVVFRKNDSKMYDIKPELTFQALVDGYNGVADAATEDGSDTTPSTDADGEVAGETPDSAESSAESPSDAAETSDATSPVDIKDPGKLRIYATKRYKKFYSLDPSGAYLPVAASDITDENIGKIFVKRNKDYILVAQAVKDIKDALGSIVEEFEYDDNYERSISTNLISNIDLTESFNTYTDAIDLAKNDNLTSEQVEMLSISLDKACNYLNINHESAVIYIDYDREYDPIYFADLSKELMHNTLAINAFDISCVRIEFRYNLYIVFKDNQDAETYMHYAN